MYQKEKEDWHVFELFFLGDFEKREMIRGYYISHRHPSEHTAGRMLLAMQEAGLLFMRENAQKSAYRFDKQEALCSGFNYVLNIGAFSAPSYWEWVFNFDTSLLGGPLQINMPAGLSNRELSFEYELPRPVTSESIDGFNLYPFYNGLIWARPNKQPNVWVAPDDGVRVELKNVKADALKKIWCVHARWELNLSESEPLPSHLTLQEAIKIAAAEDWY